MMGCDYPRYPVPFTLTAKEFSSHPLELFSHFIIFCYDLLVSAAKVHEHLCLNSLCFQFPS